MTFKKLILAALIVIVGLPCVADTKRDTQLTLEVIQAERKELVEAAVRPSPQQETKFWDTYRAYRSDVADLNNRAVKLIEEYAESFGALTDDQALRMAKEAAAIDVGRVRARKKCVKKLQSILIPKQVVRYLQIEAKMDAVMRLEMAAHIPFNL
jgi:hypothetical protein